MKFRYIIHAMHLTFRVIIASDNQLQYPKERKESKVYLVITIYKLLLAEAHKFPSGKEVCTLQGTCSAETPARSTRALIQ